MRRGARRCWGPRWSRCRGSCRRCCGGRGWCRCRRLCRCGCRSKSWRSGRGAGRRHCWGGCRPNWRELRWRWRSSWWRAKGNVVPWTSLGKAGALHAGSREVCHVVGDKDTPALRWALDPSANTGWGKEASGAAAWEVEFGRARRRVAPLRHARGELEVGG